MSVRVRVRVWVRVRARGWGSATCVVSALDESVSQKENCAAYGCGRASVSLPKKLVRVEVSLVLGLTLTLTLTLTRCGWRYI